MSYKNVICTAHFCFREGILIVECVAYIRVSTEKQAEEGHGLASQRRDIKNYCRKNGLLISEWYEDDGYTGANMNRPALQRLINDCAKKRVRCVVAFKLDRLSRSMVDGIYLIERIFQPNNIQFRCVHDSVSYDSPMEQAYTQMMAVFAQLDKNTMLLRMRGGMLERVKAGYWAGGGNLPYCYSYDKEKGVLVPIPEKAEKARMALDLFIEGYSDVKIQHMLGFKTELTVRKLLTSVTNIGLIPYKGEVYQGLHEPIFDKDKFELAQALRKNRRKAKTVCQTEANLLTGLCYCGVCGCKMRYQKWGKQGRKLYCCSRNKDLYYLPNYNADCDNKTFSAEDVEKQVEEKILQISLNVSDYRPKGTENKEEVLQSQLKNEEQKLKRLYMLYAEGNDAIVETIKEVEAVVSSIKEQLNILVEEKNDIKSKDLVYENIKKLADIWEYADKPKKNKILKSIISKIVIGKGNIEIQLKTF